MALGAGGSGGAEPITSEGHRRGSGSQLSHFQDSLRRIWEHSEPQVMHLKNRQNNAQPFFPSKTEFFRDKRTNNVETLGDLAKIGHEITPR